MCAGAIDGTHIPVETPQKDHAAYVNRKSYQSVVMQALVDDKYLFKDIVHDARVFSNSELYTLDVAVSCFQQI